MRFAHAYSMAKSVSDMILNELGKRNETLELMYEVVSSMLNDGMLFAPRQQISRVLSVYVKS